MRGKKALTNQLHFKMDFKGTHYEGEIALPAGEMSYPPKFSLRIDGSYHGHIWREPDTWHADRLKDQDFVVAIGEYIFRWYN